MFYLLYPLLLIFAVTSVRSSVFLVLTRRLPGNKLFVLLEETDHGLSFPRSALTIDQKADASVIEKNADTVFENLFGLTTWSLLSKKKSSLISQVDVLAPNPGGTPNYYYFIRLSESDLISNRKIEEYRLIEKPSNIEETSFCRNWIESKNLTDAVKNSQFISCTMLSMDDRDEYDEYRLVSNDLAAALANDKFRAFLDAKQAKNDTTDILDVNLTLSYQYSLGMLPIRLFNDEFYILLEVYDLANRGILMAIKDPKTSPFDSLKDFCQAAVKVIEARTGLKIPLLPNGEPSIINRNKRLITLSRYDFDRKLFEHILVERIDFGSFPKGNVLSVENFTTNNLIWVNLSDLLRELSSEFVYLKRVNVRVITTTKRKRVSKRKIEELEKKEAKLASKQRETSEDLLKGKVSGGKKAEGKGDIPKTEAPNGEFVESTDFGIEYDLADLLTSPRNLEILKTRLYLFRPIPSKANLYESAWTMAGLSLLVGALLPVLYYNFLLK